MNISPTVGLPALFYPAAARKGFVFNLGEPHAARIAFVHSETMVNIAAYDSNGKSTGITSVHLVPSTEIANEGEDFCRLIDTQQATARDTVEVGSAGFIDDKLAQAKLFVIAGQTATHEALMHRFDISHLHADELLVSLEKIGVVGAEAGGQRPVLIQP